MNKRIIIGIVVVVLIFVGVFIFNNKDNTASINTVSASYSDGTSVIEATFNNTDNTVTFTQSEVGTLTLPQAISASGARYANKDESVVFWEHQGELTITKDGRDIFKGLLRASQQNP